MNRYVLTETAEAELAAILEYITEHNGVERALHVLEKFVHAFETLTASPLIGTVKPDLTDVEVRWWAVFNYFVVYDAGSEPLTIIRVLHGARDVEQLLI